MAAPAGAQTGQTGQVHIDLGKGWSNYHGLDFTLTRRFSRRWQGMATYTLGSFKDAYAIPPQFFRGPDGLAQRQPVGFALVPDLGGESTFVGALAGAAGTRGDQRHRAVVSGIVDVGRGFQVSGIYLYGSGERFITATGTDRRDVGGATGGGGGPFVTGEGRLRANGSIMPRNALVGKPIHKVDLRLQQRVPLAGRVSISGLVEVFNLFNHANYGNYVVTESSALYGQPAASPYVQYRPRQAQFGIRATF